MAILKGETAIDREVSRQEALKGIILFGERERKERLAESKVILAETIRTEREIKVQKEEQIMFRKEKIRKLRKGLSRKFGKSFAKIGQAIRKKRRVKILRVAIKAKRSKIVGMFEKQQEEKSLFFKN